MPVNWLYVEKVNIEILTSEKATFSQTKLLQYTKLAIELHLCTLSELKVQAFTISNALDFQNTFLFVLKHWSNR